MAISGNMINSETVIANCYTGCGALISSNGVICAAKAGVSYL